MGMIGQADGGFTRAKDTRSFPEGSAQRSRACLLWVQAQLSVHKPAAENVSDVRTAAIVFRLVV